MPIKSFRGKLANEVIETVNLHTPDGSTGYRIVKLEVVGQQPGGFTQESTLQINTISKTPTSEIDFSDQTLLGTAYWSSNAVSENFSEDSTVIFDNVIFNQDIYVSHFGTADSNLNYHIELEQVKLDLNEATVATLKDMRAGPDTNFGP